MKNRKTTGALLALFCTSWAFAQTPVAVKNDARSPVPVRDLGAQQAVVFTGAVTLANGEWSSETYVVPPLKRLVIEHIAFDLHTVLPAVVRFRTRFDGVVQTGIHGPTGRVGERLIGNHAVKIYAGAGTAVNVGTQAGTGFAQGNITFTGYLVDIPLVFATTP